MRKVRPTPVLLALAALFLSVLAGCGRIPAEYPLPADGVSRFVNGEALTEGDIILARSYGLIGAMFANHSLEGGKYSHGAMIYRDARGRLMMLNYRPTGMETCTPEEFFSRYNRLALVRYNGDFARAKAPPYLSQWPGGAALTGIPALNAASRYWLWKDCVKRIPPDYHVDHDEHSAMFCLELASTVYRDIGLPDPFFFARKADSDPLLKTVNEMFKSEAYEIRSPSSVLLNPRFRLVSEWVLPDFDLREEALNEEVINVVVADVLKGLRPKRPRLAGRMKLRQIFVMYHLVTKSMFWKPKQDLPDFLDKEVIENAYMLYKYASRSKGAARERMRAETEAVRVGDAEELREQTLRRVREIVREECDRHRDDFMSPVGRGRQERE